MRAILMGISLVIFDGLRSRLLTDSPYSSEPAERQSIKSTAQSKGYYTPEDLQNNLEKLNPSDFCSEYSATKQNFRIQKLKMLGKGGFGEVYRVTVEKLVADASAGKGRYVKMFNGKEVADKVISYTKENSLLILKEINLMRMSTVSQTANKKTVQMLDCLYEEYQPGFTRIHIFQKIMQTDLLKMMNKNVVHPKGYYAKIDKKLWMFHAATGAVGQFHFMKLVHRDIKLENFFVDSVDGKPVPILADFGLAEYEDSKLKGVERSLMAVAGTKEYMAPEIGSKPASTKSDIYSLCITFMAYLTDRIPKSFVDYNAKPPQVHFNFLEKVLPPVVPLFKAMCSSNPESRPSTEKILEEIALLQKNRGTFKKTPTEPINSTLEAKFNTIKNAYEAQLRLAENPGVKKLIENQAAANMLRNGKGRFGKMMI